MEKKRSVWKTIGLIAGIGCLSMIAVVIAGVVIAAMMARATLRDLGDNEPRPVDRTIALPVPAEKPPARAGAADADRTAPLQLTLNLSEGMFTVKPGEPGTDIHVSGKYAPGLFELVQTQETDPATGAQRAVVRFRSKAPAWARFFAGFGGASGSQPELTVTIPRGRAIDLTLDTNMGRSEVDLGGLTLGEVNLNASMGEHHIDFHEPVVEGVRLLRINTSMGNVRIENLGNARVSTVNSSSSMGNVTASLGGDWGPGATADLNFEQSMGELLVRVPSTVRLEADVRNENGQTTRPDNTSAPTDPNAPALKVRVKSSMGNARVVRY